MRLFCALNLVQPDSSWAALDTLLVWDSGERLFCFGLHGFSRMEALPGRCTRDRYIAEDAMLGSEVVLDCVQHSILKDVPRGIGTAVCKNTQICGAVRR